MKGSPSLIVFCLFLPLTYISFLQANHDLLRKESEQFNAVNLSTEVSKRKV